METTATLDKIASLKERWTRLKTENPKIRPFDAAKQLGASEAELLATECGESVTKLDADWGDFLTELKSLGRVMALTRNAQVVHERKGEYSRVEIMREHGNMGQVLDEGIDLRLFLNHWKYGFAVRGEKRSSFQFFDAAGTAIHKVILLEDSNQEAFAELINKYRAADQSPEIEITPKPAKPAEKPDSEVDIMTFRSRWAAMQDTHEFFRLINSFGLSRPQALRLAGEDFAYRIETNGYRQILQKAAEEAMRIMIFVGNDGVIQIHSGEVKRVLPHNDWFNVMDADFNLHIYEPEITSAWVVKKPTAEGIVTSLELFNAEGENVALFFSKRKPGEAENEAWRELVTSLVKV